MAIYNYSSDEVILKIVYYGTARGGKTTNLEYIYNHSDPSTRGKLISLMTESDRTLFFDLLPMDLGQIRGLNVKIQLYTTPGQVQLNSTRKLVLKGVDALVFVGDSQKNQIESNLESLENLKLNLSDIGLDYNSIPIVFQFNKRDIENVTSIEEMNAILNPMGFPFIQASAINGEGVFDTLKSISKSAIDKAQTLRPTPVQQPPMIIENISDKKEPEIPKLNTEAAKTPGIDLQKDIIDLEEKIFDARRTLNQLVKVLIDIEWKIMKSGQ
ncbi:MAG: GTPase domain-containing protein [Candidatus Schekmanbacteria bacterium]|nr:GTPase domain-containing protein [Candidatus Schekmanbacteria bacterium]